jgi:hypothetical protein
MHPGSVVAAANAVPISQEDGAWCVGVNSRANQGGGGGGEEERRATRVRLAVE